MFSHALNLKSSEKFVYESSQSHPGPVWNLELKSKNCMISFRRYHDGIKYSFRYSCFKIKPAEKVSGEKIKSHGVHAAQPRVESKQRDFQTLSGKDVVRFNIGNKTIVLQRSSIDLPLLFIGGVAQAYTCTYRSVYEGKMESEQRGSLDFIFSYEVLGTDYFNASRDDADLQHVERPYICSSYAYFYCKRGRDDIKAVYLYF